MADQVNSVVKPKVMGKLKVQSMNVRGLSSKVVVVDAFLRQHEPDIFFIQEADLEAGVTVNFEGYNTFYSDYCSGKLNKARTIALVKSSTGYSALPPLKSFHSVAVPVALSDGRGRAGSCSSGSTASSRTARGTATTTSKSSSWSS